MTSARSKATHSMRLTPSEARIPAYLAAVGKDLYARGWRLPAQPPRAYLSATKQLPDGVCTAGEARNGRGRYYLLLGRAALRHPTEAIPPSAKACPKRIVVRCATHPGARAVARITLACARGLPARPVEVPGPYPWRVCLAFGLATRCALEAALRQAPGTTLAEWIRHCLRQQETP